jgi:hypothetical protein
MALNDIVFIKGQGGLGRPLPGQDYVSGLVLYGSNLPSGFSTTNRIKQFFSLADAVNAGILGDYSDATSAIGSYLFTSVGSNGDTINLFVTEPAGLKLIGTYVKVSGDTTVTALGNKMAIAINSGTVTHGYSASASTGTVTITAPKSFGIFLNTGTPISVVIVGTIAGTITQFSGGVSSVFAVWYYHISEFFRISPKGVLYVGIFSVPSNYDFTEITTMQNFAVGTIRQIAVYKDAIWAVGDLTVISNVCIANDTVHKPISALYAANLVATTDISTISDLSALSANKVSTIISQDGGGQGLFLFQTTGKSITNLGAELGAVALSKVSESIAWVGKFNISNGIECEILSFANGVLFSDATVNDNLLSALNNKRHIFLRKFVGLAGSYFNDSHTAIAFTSDYAYIENNRTIDKGIRGIYNFLLPSLNSPIQLNKDGSISETTIAYLVSQAGLPLDQMVRDSELGAYAVTINPLQNVLATSKIIVAVTLVINGVARNIVVPIGFKPSIA